MTRTRVTIVEREHVADHDGVVDLRAWAALYVREVAAQVQREPRDGDRVQLPKAG